MLREGGTSAIRKPNHRPSRSEGSSISRPIKREQVADEAANEDSRSLVNFLSRAISNAEVRIAYSTEFAAEGNY